MRGLAEAEGRDSCGVGAVVSVGGTASHRIVELGLRTLERLAHRGAENADGRTGDGAGITVQVPHAFYMKLGIPLPAPGSYGTGIIFLPREGTEEAWRRFLEACSENGLSLLASREVPADHSVPGPLAQRSEPVLRQAFLVGGVGGAELERRLYLARRRAESLNKDVPEFYVCSLSSRTIVYKGMLAPGQLRQYYPDLSDPSFASAVALVHSRFSTNTMPQWKLAQPFRMMCHNGEINTISGNRSWMRARERLLVSKAFPDLSQVTPVIQPGMSDSALLDNVLEFLTLSGMPLTHALAALIPESWNSRNPIPDSLKAFYEYHSMMMEPWDGPAAVLFTDGRVAGGMLDRNGLRPVRYTVTKDGLFILASEAGVLDVPSPLIAESGRICPGKMIMVDMQAKRILRDPEIKEALASAYPYRDWLEKNRIDLGDVSSGRTVDRRVPDAPRLMREFLWSKEDVERVIVPMAGNGKEPVGSAGSDIPLPPLSDVPQSFFNYFRQSFAQVTNPAIDPIREELVMSITGYIGSVHNNLLAPAPDNCRIVKVRHPVVTDRELDLLRNLSYRGFTTITLPITFPVSDGPAGLEKALDNLREEAEKAVRKGISYLILSDRGTDADLAPIPSLLATAAVHQHLVDKGLRVQTGIIVETGEAREVEHVALLFAYGANLVNPYLAFAEVGELAEQGRLGYDPDTAEARYVRALENGIKKVMSKMGISTIRSYRGSCLFEAVGLDRELCAKYLCNTPSRLGGIGAEEIAKGILAHHAEVFCGDEQEEQLPDLGIYGYKKNGERHFWSPGTVKLLRKAAVSGNEEDYEAFAKEAEAGGAFSVRDLMEPVNGKSIPLDEVEPASEILKRFVVEAMSFGAISREAHETAAEAANALGARSNCGEGGEDPARTGSNRSKVRQVASGRFGVDARYLASADEIQIKCAQGAKPGEGGQLMGFKVDAVIAATRRTLPGVTLISPPPHHDIYSIEDLKQLILDLRCVNPQAKISVKLVSEAGVGTVASGVAKAGADIILISGGDGGTGAAPLSSMRYAGMPWEVGLASAQQTLMANGLRGRVVLQADGHFRTGRDVVTAALLGAEEYGFATAVNIAMGCVMCRKCQTNKCPTGIATQDPELRKRFAGTPAHVMNYLTEVAEDVRRRLAAMGFRSLGEIVGRADLLRASKESPLDLTPLFEAGEGTRSLKEGQPDMLDGQLDRRLIEDAMPKLEKGKSPDLYYEIRNTDRSTGAMLAGELTRRNIVPRAAVFRFEGTAGQSFGAFLTEGVEFRLDGMANDFVGKGLSGGVISVFRSDAPSEPGVLVGNTAMYGATAGELYVAGSAGERFCVRNSGAVAVAEGVGDHCCEYMTGGRVVVLGPCGRNFAAGMSAGVAYVLDDTGDFDRHCNMDMVELELLEDENDRNELKAILEKHLAHTGSVLAKSLLKDWPAACKRFVKVIPVGYKALLRDESN
ncbi:MAG: glutamate synthase large subunit [Methanomethylophilus sp.]|jgi:glutamate synthase (NADPH/NADH) large chain